MATKETHNNNALNAEGKRDISKSNKSTIEQSILPCKHIKMRGGVRVATVTDYARAEVVLLLEFCVTFRRLYLIQ